MHARLLIRRGLNCCAALALGTAAGASAQPASLLPTPVGGEARMVTFDYDDDRIYKVLVRPKNATQLEFRQGEVVTYVSAGDKSNFIVTVPSSRAFIEVKPKWEDSSTNLLVVTSQRSYHIDLQSTGEGRKWYTRVAWTHEDSAGLDATGAPASGAAAGRDVVRRGGGAASDIVSQGIDLDRMNVAYSVVGDAEFRPVQVFDDGTRTYVRMPEHLQELPALFMLTPDTGELALVNYTVVDSYLVVQRTMDQFLLQLGKAQVRVERQRQGGFWSMFGGRRPAAEAAPSGEVGERVAR
jgi:P-type conjugative transfer protein TrbG